MYTIQHVTRAEKPEKESIHSGHFMVSHFEAEEQDDEDNLAVPIPDTGDVKSIVPLVPVRPRNIPDYVDNKRTQQQVAIDTSLSKLFQCMSLAYRQKLTSPKWNRFRGIRLRWKDKIRLNNVIWRCWHLQFIKKENTLICQFASPLDVDTHNKPEAVVLEGKYWKRKLAAVTAEYKRWRMFYRNNILGHMPKDPTDTLHEMDLLAWDSNSSDNMNMMVDEDYMGLMSDTLFSTITNQPFVFPDSREIAKAGLADFIQPSLGPLQPNLDDYMDTFDPLQEFISSRLPTVPEESHNSHPQPVEWGYLDNSLSTAENSLEVTNLDSSHTINQYQLSPMQHMLLEKQVPIQDTRQTQQQQPQPQQSQALVSPTFNEMMLGQFMTDNQPPSYPSVISKNNMKTMKSKQANVQVYSKSMENVYSSYSQQQVISAQPVDRICLSTTSQVPPPQPQPPTPPQPPQQQLQEMQQFKLSKATTSSQNVTRQESGYKFPVPTAPNIKFSSPQVQHPQMIQPTYTTLSQYSSAPITPKEEKVEPRRRGAPRGSRGRSRSNTREPIKRPPLVFSVSDPTLLTQQTSALLTQLLSNNTSTTNSVYNQGRNLAHSTPDMLSNRVRIKEESTTVTTLPQSPPAALIKSGQVSISTAQPSASDPLILTSYSNSNSPIMDPLSQNMHSPTSSQSSIGSPCADSSLRDRRTGHIHAEQKRRYNIKNGFDMIHSLIPHLNQNPNAKLSKAAMLQKGAEYIRQLQTERNQLKEEMESLRQQIDTLNTSISNCQSMLPATGAPVSRRTDNKMQEMFDEYVRNRTMDNWKFWIFSLIFRPLLNSFNNFVSTSSLDDLYSSTMHWIEQHCTLVDLRPVVLNSLRYLCTKTEILSDPDKLPDEARQIALESSQNQNN